MDVLWLDPGYLSLCTHSKSLHVARGMCLSKSLTQSLSKCMRALMGHVSAKSSFHTHALLDWVMGRSSSSRHGLVKVSPRAIYMCSLREGLPLFGGGQSLHRYTPTLV